MPTTDTPIRTPLPAPGRRQHEELTRLVTAQYIPLLRLAHVLGAGHDAEDVVAEAFLALHRSWNHLRSPQAAAAYLRATVVNLARQRIRSRVRGRRALCRHGRSAEPAPSAEQQALLREEHRVVVRALHGLPSRQREALVLRYWLDLSESGIAATMGISTGAVKSHTHRGMAALRRTLAEGEG